MIELGTQATQMTRMNQPRSRYLADPFKPLIQTSLQRKNSIFSKAIFFDRDGTVNVEKGYITNSTEIELYPASGAVLKKFKLQGRLIIIISNQSAIGRGLMTVNQFEQVNQALWNQLTQLDAGYDALYYCPHIPDNACECRKPKPGLILQAALDFNIDLSESYMIGDKLSDIEAGKLAGCRTILIMTGIGVEAAEIIKKNTLVVQPDMILASLSDALIWIESKQNGSD